MIDGRGKMATAFDLCFSAYFTGFELKKIMELTSDSPPPSTDDLYESKWRSLHMKIITSPSCARGLLMGICLPGYATGGNRYQDKGCQKKPIDEDDVLANPGEWT